MPFKDHFSKHAHDYAKYRPRYPADLFKYVACVAPDRRRAWDCATGNGQAALGLADFFEHVIATDASEKQIASAVRHKRITYRVVTAEQSELEAASVDLITIAQALHWFDREAFYREAKRVLKPNGVLAAWCYDLLKVSPEIDALLENFYRETIGPYWDFERQLVETGYRTLAFPFVELAPPKFQMKADWSLAHLLGYLRTWSATKSFITARGFDPVTDLGDQLLTFWGEPKAIRTVVWPLNLRTGKTVPR
jgi:SAM-dependent methyltransferase